MGRALAGVETQTLAALKQGLSGSRQSEERIAIGSLRLTQACGHPERPRARADGAARRRRRPAAPPAVAAVVARKKRNGVRRFVLLFVLPIAAAARRPHWWLGGGRYVSTDNAYVGADKALITPYVTGPIIAVARRGGPEGRGRRSIVRHRSRALSHRAGARQGPAGGGQGRIRELARQSYMSNRPDQDGRGGRQAPAGRLRSQAALLDHARGNGASISRHLRRRAGPGASKSSSSSEQQQESAKVKLGGGPDAPIETFPDYMQAKAQVEDAERNLGYAHVIAPIAGVATQVAQIELGRVAPAGQPVFAVVADTGLWVDANPKESDLTYVTQGLPATVTVDTFPDREWRGKVCSIAPGTGAQFAILPPQNASGNWVKVVQRVPLALLLRSRPGHDGTARRHERRSSRSTPAACGRSRASKEDLGGMGAAAGSIAAKASAAATIESDRDRAATRVAADRLRDDGDHHAGARHHHRQCRAALYAGLAVDDAGSGQLGADLLHRRRRDHDLAARLDGDAVRPQEAVHRLRRRLHRRLDAVRGRPDASSRWSVSACCRAFSARRWCR